jgi:hypothetical protein
VREREGRRERESFYCGMISIFADKMRPEKLSEYVVFEGFAARRACDSRNMHSSLRYRPGLLSDLVACTGWSIRTLNCWDKDHLIPKYLILIFTEPPFFYVSTMGTSRSAPVLPFSPFKALFLHVMSSIVVLFMLLSLSCNVIYVSLFLHMSLYLWFGGNPYPTSSYSYYRVYSHQYAFLCWRFITRHALNLYKMATHNFVCVLFTSTFVHNCTRF